MNWRSTQFWFCVAVMVAATVLVRAASGLGTVLTGANWMALALVVLGAFGIRKVAQHRNDAANIGWTSTQLVLSLAIVAVATWLAGLGVVSGDSWMAVAGVALGMFGVRATVQHRKDRQAPTP
jgi:hypothetical protein